MPFSRILLSFIVFVGMFLAVPGRVWAAYCTDSPINATVEGVGVTLDESVNEHTITVSSQYLELGNYRARIFDNATDLISPLESTGYSTRNTYSDTLSFTFRGKGIKYNDLIGSVDTVHVYLYKGDSLISLCKIGKINIVEKSRLTCDALEIYQYRKFDKDGDGVEEENKCYSSGCIDARSKIYITGGNFKNRGKLINWGALTFKCGREGDLKACHDGYVSIINGQLKLYGTDISVNWGPGDWTYTPQSLIVGKNWEGACQGSLKVRPSCPNTPVECHSTFRAPKNQKEGAVFELCSQIADPTQRTACQDCAISSDSKEDGQAGVWTAIGCIKRSPTSILQQLISLGLSIGGGVSLIMTLAGGFILTTSKGDPKRTAQAKEMITSAIIGLIFVIFSVVILQFIGFTVLKIPGFGR